MAKVVDSSGNSPFGAGYVDRKEEKLLEASLAATGNSNGVEIFGKANVVLSGTWVGTAAIQRSFDGGATYQTVDRDSAGTGATFTANANLTIEEPERGVLYRINFTRTSGTLEVRISR